MVMSREYLSRQTEILWRTKENTHPFQYILQFQVVQCRVQVNGFDDDLGHS